MTVESKGLVVRAIHYRYADIDDQQLFYREAGPADAPALVLMHGFPTSSYMFRDLIPLLAVWGANDEIFGPDGARAFAADAPSAEIQLLDGGHFLLESHLDAVSGYVRRFLERAVS